jgi:hypothetical protein
MTQQTTKETPKTKKLVILRGKGTAKEQRIETNTLLYWVEAHGRWVTIPE